MYGDDEDCDIGDEPGASDFLSPCLEQAALMAVVMDPDDYVPWLDSLLPPMDSEDFASVRTSALADSTRRSRIEDLMEAAGIPFSSDFRSSPMAARLSELTGDTEAEILLATSLNDTTPASRARRSHLIGLAFARADAMLRIAAALPATDPRVQELRSLAAQHGRTGLETMFDAGYAGSHWIGSFALKYLVEAGREDDP